ncbi:SMC family ATPase [Cytophagaceae bacterium ABcell3]|nr:SMC family ATPase [Cytophagaceae bacterium ABcell3]
MIPISLTLQGIYSYQKAETIDFTRLLEGQLFGIFGAVGSGKSTILEAISFALYGETERLNRTDGRNYNMMNLKSDELLIDFQFKNFEEQVYRFIVKGKRNGKNFDKVSTLERTAFKKTGPQNWEPIPVTTAASLLGNLSYDNFRRTIIIPQGKFQEFLQLTDGDRTKMLKEIFNLNKFEFSIQTSSLIKKNDEQIHHLNGRLVKHENINQEAFEQNQAYIAKLKSEREKLNKQCTQLQQTEKEQLELKKLTEELLQKEQKLNELEQQKGQFEQLELKLKEYETCLQKFSSKIERLKNLRQELKEKTTLMEKISSQEKEYQKNYKTKEEAFAIVEQDHKSIEIWKNELDDYSRLIKIFDLSNKSETLGKRIENGKKQLEQSGKEKESLENNIRKLKTQIKELNTQLPDLSLLYKVKEWFSEKNNISTTLNKLKNELQEVQAEVKHHEKSYSEKLPAFITEKNTTPEQVTHFAERLIEDCNSRLAKIEDALSGYKLQEKLKEYTQSLKDGSPCPLCGAKEHPSVMDVENVREHITAANTEIQQIKKDIDNYTEIIKQTERFSLNVANLAKQEKTISDKIALEEKALLNHQDKFEWDNLENEQQVNEQIEKATLLNKEIEKQKSALEEKDTQLEKLLKDFEKFRKAIEAFERDAAAFTAEKQSYISQLKVLEAKQDKPISWYENQSVELKERINQTESKHKTLFEQIQNLKQEIAALKGKSTEVGETVAKLQNNISITSQELETSLQESGYQNIADIEEILASNPNLSVERERIYKFREVLFQTAEEIKKLKALTDNRPFSEENYKLLVKELEEVQQKFQQTNDTLVEEKARAEQIKKDLKEKNELQAELEKLNQRAENLKLLSNMFRGSGFVEYISGVFLHDLCQAANERFYRLTRQQLRLEINEKNNFQVRDFLNNGRVRSVKTLSGGQTFQASLSLALALAERIQQQNKAKQNFFFLDEGFGSQDKQSLQIVFDTLKSLRKENRIVGVISHVEELQQEIDVFLKIKNDPERGSKVSKSWEGLTK